MSSQSGVRPSASVITSETHPLLVLPMPLGTKAIFVTPAPGYNGSRYKSGVGHESIERNLVADVASLKRFGINRLVTTLAGDVILDAEMGGLLTELEANGIEWSHLPFPLERKHEANFASYLHQEMQVIRKNFEGGQKIAVHGIGYGRFMERRLAIIATMLDSNLAYAEARALSVATLGLGRAMMGY